MSKPFVSSRSLRRAATVSASAPAGTIVAFDLSSFLFSVAVYAAVATAAAIPAHAESSPAHAENRALPGLLAQTTPAQTTPARSAPARSSNGARAAVPAASAGARSDASANPAGPLSNSTAPNAATTAAPPGTGAGALSLSAATSTALDNDREGSFSLQRSSSVARGSAARERESFSYFLPTLQASGNHLLGRKYVLTDIAFGGNPNPVSIPQILADTQFNVTAQWWVFDGFANFDRFAGARMAAEAASREREWIRFRTEREIKLAYYQVLTQLDLIRVAEETRNALKVHRDDAQRFLNVGSGTRYDLLRTESQLGQAEVDVLSAQDLEQTYRSKLFELLGREDRGERLDGQLPDLSDAFEARIVAYKHTDDVSYRPDLEALDLRASGLARTSRAASLYFVPRIGLFYQLTEYNNLSTNLTDGYRQAYQYGVNFTWNIFDGLYSSSKAAQAAEEKVQADVALEQGRLQSLQDELIWKRKFQTSARLVEARSVEVAKADEAARIARTGRRSGTITNTQLLDAEVESFRAKAGLLNARLSEVESLLRFELATGRSFE